MLTTLVLASLQGTLCGCATTIVPPAHVDQPVTAYIFDYGRHSGLVLPAHDPRGNPSETIYVEYTYGEWGWVAENRAGPVGAVRALLIPSRGSLGHRSFSEHPEVFAETEQLPAVYQFTVDREAVLELHRQLAREWELRSPNAVFNDRFGLDFVKADESYTLLNNCNQVLARWARELGCEVRGWPVLSNWRIREPSRVSSEDD